MIDIKDLDVITYEKLRIGNLIVSKTNELLVVVEPSSCRCCYYKNQITNECTSPFERCLVKLFKLNSSELAEYFVKTINSSDLLMNKFCNDDICPYYNSTDCNTKNCVINKILNK